MATHYVFYKEDIINMLLNYHGYTVGKLKDEVEKNGPLSLKSISNSDFAKWAEEYFEKELARGEIKLATLLDEVDSIMKHTHGMTALERAKQKKGH